VIFELSGIVCGKPFYAHGALKSCLKIRGIQAVYADDFTCIRSMSTLIVADNVFFNLEGVFY